MMDEIPTASSVERLVLRAYGSLIGAFYPELRRLPDPADRWRALMILGMAEPRWKGCLGVTLFGAASVVASIGVVLFAAHLHHLGWPAVSSWFDSIFVAGVGILVLGCLCAWIDGLRTQEACRKLMDILEAAVCNSCGYNLFGHLGEAWAICPECGERNEMPHVESIKSLR